MSARTFQGEIMVVCKFAQHFIVFILQKFSPLNNYGELQKAIYRNDTLNQTFPTRDIK